LTDDQEKNLHDIIAKLQSYVADRTKELDVLRVELNKMITDKAELYKIKAKLRAMAQIQADASYEDIVSSRAIEKELTATQLSQWHNIQEAFRKNQQQAQGNAASKQKG
jgi:RPA family protein